jgi:hypothetical protein
MHTVYSCNFNPITEITRAKNHKVYKKNISCIPGAGFIGTAGLNETRTNNTMETNDARR